MMIALILIVSVVFCDHQLPLWPPQFQVPFSSSVEGANSTVTWKAMFYYDYPNLKSRLDYAKGQYDGTCLSVMPTVNEECRLIQNGDWRYVYWPTLDKCCKCCNVSAGCGVLTQDWIIDGTYVGEKDFSDVTCDGWEKDGFGKNYYYMKPATPYGIPCAVVMDYTSSFGIADVYIYDQSQYKAGPIDKSVFDVPDNCDDRCSGALCNE